MRDVAQAAFEHHQELPDQYKRDRTLWTYLGIPSFLCMGGILLLMQFRHYFQ
jgi:uncharacterized membrane protein